MILLKYICFVIAMITSGLYINNLIADITKVMTWRNNFVLEGKEKSLDDSEQYANSRFILSIIIAVTWGVVFIL